MRYHVINATQATAAAEASASQTRPTATNTSTTRNGVRSAAANHFICVRWSTRQWTHTSPPDLLHSVDGRLKWGYLYFASGTGEIQRKRLGCFHLLRWVLRPSWLHCSDSERLLDSQRVLHLQFFRVWLVFILWTVTF